MTCSFGEATVSRGRRTLKAEGRKTSGNFEACEGAQISSPVFVGEVPL
jgi:hypothetical protein